MEFIIGSEITPQTVHQSLIQSPHLAMGPDAEKRIVQSFQYLQKKIAEPNSTYYGINTGFGSLYSVKIQKDQLAQLQKNLLRSHACGQGAVVPKDIVKLMLLFKINALSYGHSGVSYDLVAGLTKLYNKSLIPVVYQQGSLGASGDLAPLAHLALPLIGEGELWDGDKIEDAGKLYNSTLNLNAKEGLALINGTQFMSAYGAYILHRFQRILELGTLIAAISLEAFDGRQEAFWPYSHAIRPHPGQVRAAQTVFNALQGSELINQPKEHIQDPYSFRCVPQVHGASWDVWEQAQKIIYREINAVTDNPNIFPEEDLIISAGNFHGQPLALQLDFMGIALSELGSISERRIYKMMNGERGLPAYLIANSGINSGFMIAQYTAASIASENKQLCTPASADSIVSSNGQEDHVSMGANAATKCLRILENTERILGIEWLTAAQGLEFRRPLKSSPQIEALYTAIRERIPALENDRFMHKDMDLAVELFKSFDYTSIS